MDSSGEKSYHCIECAFSLTIRSHSVNIEQKLSKSEKAKKYKLENFLRRIDLFQACLGSNLETNKRKTAECQQRYENDVTKVDSFFEHLSRIFNEVYTKYAFLSQTD